MKETYIIIAVCILVGVALALVFFKGGKSDPVPGYTPDQRATTSTPVVIKPNTIAYGEVKNVRLGQTLRFADFSLKLTKVELDDRCPADAKCSRLGTTIVSGEFVDVTGTTIKVIELEKNTTLGSYTVFLVRVDPDAISTHRITADEYRFTLNVQK